MLVHDFRPFRGAAWRRAYRAPLPTDDTLNAIYAPCGWVGVAEAAPGDHVVRFDAAAATALLPLRSMRCVPFPFDSAAVRCAVNEILQRDPLRAAREIWRYNVAPIVVYTPPLWLLLTAAAPNECCDVVVPAQYLLDNYRMILQLLAGHSFSPLHAPPTPAPPAWATEPDIRAAYALFRASKELIAAQLQQPDNAIKRVCDSIKDAAPGVDDLYAAFVSMHTPAAETSAATPAEPSAPAEPIAAAAPSAADTPAELSAPTPAEPSATEPSAPAEPDAAEPSAAAEPDAAEPSAPAPAATHAAEPSAAEPSAAAEPDAAEPSAPTPAELPPLADDDVLGDDMPVLVFRGMRYDAVKNSEKMQRQYEKALETRRKMDDAWQRQIGQIFDRYETLAVEQLMQFLDDDGDVGDKTRIAELTVDTLNNMEMMLSSIIGVPVEQRRDVQTSKIRPLDEHVLPRVRDHCAELARRAITDASVQRAAHTVKAVADSAWLLPPTLPLDDGDNAIDAFETILVRKFTLMRTLRAAGRQGHAPEAGVGLVDGQAVGNAEA